MRFREDTGSLQRAVPALVAGGFAGGVLGLAIGLLGGFQLGALPGLCPGGPCPIAGASYGAMAGVLIGIPLGVNLTNRRQGRLLGSFLACVVVLIMGDLAIGNAHNARAVPILATIPFVQLAVAILMERTTAKPRTRGAERLRA